MYYCLQFITINGVTRKLPRKKWFICGECEFFTECVAGQNKMQNIYVDSKVYAEIGCFEHEQYYLSRQLKIF